MVAQGDDPWVSVSVLGEQLFCRRAGVINFESSYEDDGSETSWATGQRRWVGYSLYEIKERLERLFLLSALPLAFGVIVWVLRRHVEKYIGVYVFLVLFALAIAFLLSLQPLLSVLVLYLRAVLAIARIPDPENCDSKPVSWWALLQAGFENRELSESLRDTDWRLVGRPWRILAKGDLRIPVFRRRGGGLDSGRDPNLYPQHIARIAAYCHLVEKCMLGKSPYGIILYGHSWKGTTVPYHPGTRSTFYDALIRARKLLRISLAGDDPPPPGNRHKCLRCPYGDPNKGPSPGASLCGIRFQWQPPHASVLVQSEINDAEEEGEDGQRW
jgi:hypothetical protein